MFKSHKIPGNWLGAYSWKDLSGDLSCFLFK
jgi:hypothetical protein